MTQDPTTPAVPLPASTPPITATAAPKTAAVPLAAAALPDTGALAPAADVPRPVSRKLSGAVLLALLTVYTVWGSTYFAIRVTLESLPPFLQGGTRFVVAGTLLFGFLTLRGRPMPTGRQWRDGAIVGVLLLACGNGGVVFSEQYVSSSVAAIFIGAGPLAAALWSGLFGVWPQRVQWVGILIGFGGILLLAGGSQLAAQPAGLVALVISVITWTLGSVLAQRAMRLAPGAMGFATEMLAGGAVMLVVGALRGEIPQLLAAWPPTPAASMAFVYLIVIGSLVGFSAYMYLLSQVSSTIAISYAYVNPMVAVLLGWLLGGEMLTQREGIATAIIVGSVILLTREKRTATNATT